MIYIPIPYLFWKLRYGTCQLFVYMHENLFRGSGDIGLTSWEYQVGKEF